MLSFGDPRPFTELVRQSGAMLIIQVTDLDEAGPAGGLRPSRIGTWFLATAALPPLPPNWSVCSPRKLRTRSVRRWGVSL